MKIHACEQGSVAWFEARAGLPTASEFDQLVTPDWKIRTGQMPASYLAKKLAEKWIGGPLPGFNSFDTEQGHILEFSARDWYALEYEEEVEQVGFITTDDGKAGCSPDGLLGPASGLEIKCPAAHTHVAYLMANQLPKDYAAQVQGSMYVTGRDEWVFLSYRRGFPALRLVVEVDRDAQTAIGVAVEKFSQRLDEEFARLVELNGGLPKSLTLPEGPKPRFSWEPDPDDVIP